MEKDKNKKKTLTISSSFGKKLDSKSYKQSGKKSFSIEKKPTTKSPFKYKYSKPGQNLSPSKGKPNKKNFARKFVEEQATKRFIHTEKEKAFDKTKDFQSKRELKLTISRAMNVEEFEIKQRSLASVRRARLKEKKNLNQEDQKKRI